MDTQEKAMTDDERLQEVRDLIAQIENDDRRVTISFTLTAAAANELHDAIKDRLFMYADQKDGIKRSYKAMSLTVGVTDQQRLDTELVLRNIRRGADELIGMHDALALMVKEQAPGMLVRCNDAK